MRTSLTAAAAAVLSLSFAAPAAAETMEPKAEMQSPAAKGGEGGCPCCRNMAMMQQPGGGKTPEKPGLPHMPGTPDSPKQP